jgi:hypothetical protein
VFFKEFEDEFWYKIECGFGIRDNECIYAYRVENDAITDSP